MQISGNQTKPSLVNKPHAKVFPNQINRFLDQLCVMVHYHEAKSLRVAFFDIPVVFHTQSLIQIEHLLSVAFSINGFARF